jgi:transposase, IS30 family
VVEIREGLRRGWSPQQIAGRWQQQGRAAAERLSHESVYALIGADRKAGGTLWQMLPRGGKRRRRDRCGTRHGHRLKVTPSQEIAARPAEINERKRAGDWEVDLMIGARQHGVLLVAVERPSRMVRCRALESKEAAVVQRALVAMLCREVVLSLTFDRGLEWMRHEAIAAALGAKSYFCQPYHSWQKGGVENMNGLLRRYLPKGISFPCEEMDHEWLRGNSTGARAACTATARRRRWHARVGRGRNDPRPRPPRRPDCVRGRSGLRASPCPRCARDGLRGP